jgi:hypothetical protein
VTYGIVNAGTHTSVTFEGSALNPSFAGQYYQIFPQQFPLPPASAPNGSYIESFIENQPTAGNPITGYLPFVKSMGSYLGITGSGPLTVVPQSLNVNIASVTQNGMTGVLSINFSVPLIYPTYMIIFDAQTGATVLSRTTTGFSVSGYGRAGQPFQFMVI